MQLVGAEELGDFCSRQPRRQFHPFRCDNHFIARRARRRGGLVASGVGTGSDKRAVSDFPKKDVTWSTVDHVTAFYTCGG